MRIFIIYLFSALAFQKTLVSGAGTRLRLVGGNHPGEGRVEITSPYRGTVCDDEWTTGSSKVVCKMLGLPYTSALSVTGAYFGPGSGNIVLDDVKCRGTETDISQCPRNGWKDHNCGHGEDIGVICGPRPNGITCPVVPCPDCKLTCPTITCPDLTCPNITCQPTEIDWAMVVDLLQNNLTLLQGPDLLKSVSQDGNPTSGLYLTVAIGVAGLFVGIVIGCIAVIAYNTKKKRKPAIQMASDTTSSPPSNDYCGLTSPQTDDGPTPTHGRTESEIYVNVQCQGASASWAGKASKRKEEAKDIYEDVG